MGALAKVEELHRDRSKRVRELKAEGKKIIGYFCCYPPEEIITAAGAVPYRITGNIREPITVADAYVETNACPYIRSCFDIGAKGGYDFLDGMVTVHSCLAMDRLSHIWQYFLKKPASCYRLDVPHVIRPSAFEFFQADLGTLRRNIEEFLGTRISRQSLCDAIKLHNKKRALIRELYYLMKRDPPLLSGSEMTQISVAAMSLPVVEGIELLRAVLEEAKGRKGGPSKKAARLLLWGCPIDDTPFIQLIEECGANVVIDDHCIGTRHYWYDVETGQEPLAALAYRYLGKIPCPRTYRDYTGAHKSDLEARFNYIRDFTIDFRANGAILYVLRFCDTHAYTAVDLRDFLQQAGFPFLHLEHDYSTAGLEAFRTRIEAFIEMITQSR